MCVPKKTSSAAAPRALGSQGEGVLRVPPVKEPHAVHRVQDHLYALLTAQLPTAADRDVLEQQSHAMVPHVRAHADGEQGEYHSHDNWDKDEIEGGDLQQAAVLVWVAVDVFVLNRRLQAPHTLAL